MKLGLRTKILGTLLLAIVIAAAIGAIAARQTMATDLNDLANQEVSNGSTGFAGYWDVKRDLVRGLVTQAAINEAVRSETSKRDAHGLEATLSGIARQGGLAWLTAVDTNGKVIARANGGSTGVKLNSPFIERSLSGETVNTAAKIPHDELDPEGLVPQIESTVQGREGLSEGLGLVASTPISDANERTIGAVYGGILIDHYYDIVDQAARALGGKSAVVFDGQLISSSIVHKKGDPQEGTRLVDETYSRPIPNAGNSWSGIDTESDTYLARLEPILDDQSKVIAGRWYGVPLAKYTDIQNHTLMSLLLWSLVGVVIGMLVAIPVVSRLSDSLTKRSRQVRASAKELSLVIVGSEVSGDHVAQTRAAVEKQGELLAAAPASPNVTEAAALNAEIYGDIIVIDTLATEMASRTQQAVARVGELNEVAAGLDELVNGSK
jgi:hypothetical protein